ncbi:MAG: Trk system potassium transport protein TrkA [Deltaproteobacteria bacterium RIFOXYD12_FULL_57_12]|nr:MAG: Trk system potassium transport protein TrkA [Deltaproteobacteria bacterium RIFOXYD12_FULL_57_12]
MRIMIVGAGQVGYHLSKKFSMEGQEVVLVDRDESKLRRLERELNIMTVHGSGASARTLEEAGIDKSDLFIAVTDSDEVNLVACILSRQYQVKKRIARVRSDDFLSPGSPLNEQALGVDLLISPDRAMTDEIIQLSNVSEAFDVVEFADGHVLLLGYVVQPNNPCAGLSLKQLKKLRGSYRFLVVAIIRQGTPIIPRGDDRIEVHDKIYLMVRREDIPAVEELFNLSSRKPDLVFIIGGGNIGYMVARRLEEKGIDVRLVEEDPDHCEILAKQLEHTLVLNFDGLESNVLLEEGIDRADLVISVTDSDTTNILSSLLAKHHGAKKCITKITRPDFIPLLGKLGIDVALSPRQVAADMILRFVRRGAIVSVATLLASDAEVIELKVPDHQRFRDAPLKALAFPHGAIVGAIVRDSQVFIPSGETTLQPGDNLIIFFTKDAIHHVESFFAVD